jgi:hypothetical protein
MRVFKKESTIDHNPVVQRDDIEALNKAENDLLECRNMCPNGSSISGFLQNLSYLVHYYRSMCVEGTDSADFGIAKTMAKQTLGRLKDYLDDNLIKSVSLEK